MKKTFILNDSANNFCSQTIKRILRTLDVNITEDLQHTLLEIDFPSEHELPLYYEHRGETGFSKSEGTLFWGKQWIGSFDPKEEIPLLTFCNYIQKCKNVSPKKISSDFKFSTEVNPSLFSTSSQSDYQANKKIKMSSPEPYFQSSGAFVTRKNFEDSV